MDRYDLIKEDHKKRLENNSFQRDEENLTKKEYLIAQLFVCIGIFIIIFLINITFLQEENPLFTNISNAIEIDKTKELQSLVEGIVQETTINETAIPSTNEIEAPTTNEEISTDTSIENDFNTDFKIDEELLDTLDNHWNLGKPVKSGIITSLFGKRINPLTKEIKIHEGIDIANKIGTEIYSVSDGIVITSAFSNSYGNYVIVQYDNFEFTYAHLEKRFTNTGDLIKKGDKIGTMGATGAVTGVHLHFEVKINNENIDPLFLVKDLKISN